MIKNFSLAANRALRPSVASTSRGFAWKHPDNEHLIDPQFSKAEQEAYDKLSQEQKDLLAKERLRLIEFRRIQDADPKDWRNVLGSMTKEEFTKLPYGFVKKYGTYLLFQRRMMLESKVRENKEQYNGYYDQVKDIDRLFTDEEKKESIDRTEDSKQPDIVKIVNLVREEGDYYKRQPRVDPAKLSYNFEQFKRYSTTLASAIEKDNY